MSPIRVGTFRATFDQDQESIYARNIAEFFALGVVEIGWGYSYHPAQICNADWGSAANKRWFAGATFGPHVRHA
jgi:hypothetical protein